ncbi:MAG: hypothetical protein C0402_08280 [Thermodesulfovibrio sp.]|nr:hypothetical protein [Thermodesulfovibrio sp.]
MHFQPLLPKAAEGAFSPMMFVLSRNGCPARKAFLRKVAGLRVRITNFCSNAKKYSIISNNFSMIEAQNGA